MRWCSLEDAMHRLGRPVNPTVYSSQELAKSIRADNAFVTRLRKQPKLWLIGEEHGFGA